jgi:retron-type reverse transcriptase
MNQPTKEFKYSQGPIRSVATLAKALGIDVETLSHQAAVANSSYRLAKPIEKADGSMRQPYDARPPLKAVHRRIHERIFAHVEFPAYLTGSLKGKDAVRNAELHSSTATIVTEDVRNFFPSISAELVCSIFRNFFGFSTEVAQLLTALCTLEGAVPQGAITSSHLANLAFWDIEGELFQYLESEGVTYSRYVDDVTISSPRSLTIVELTAYIRAVYRMMARKGFSPKRSKQEIQRGDGRMRVTKLLVNAKASLSSGQRHSVRTAVFQLECMVKDKPIDDEIRKAARSVSGRVGYLARLHPREGKALKARLSPIMGLL